MFIIENLMKKIKINGALFQKCHFRYRAPQFLIGKVGALFQKCHFWNKAPSFPGFSDFVVPHPKTPSFCDLSRSECLLFKNLFKKKQNKWCFIPKVSLSL